jgi:CRP/FNR family cyclic AMP-dependent transcriptional regulator
VRIMLNRKETLLATLTVGDFFGDVSLFDHGPRSADVVANTDSILARISSSAVEELSKDAPEVANLFLRRIGQTLSSRMRANIRRLADFARFA